MNIVDGGKEVKYSATSLERSAFSLGFADLRRSLET
jgi:hypothetical protein